MEVFTLDASNIKGCAQIRMLVLQCEASVGCGCFWWNWTQPLSGHTSVYESVSNSWPKYFTRAWNHYFLLLFFSFVETCLLLAFDLAFLFFCLSILLNLDVLHCRLGTKTEWYLYQFWELLEWVSLDLGFGSESHFAEHRVWCALWGNCTCLSQPLTIWYVVLLFRYGSPYTAYCLQHVCIPQYHMVVLLSTNNLSPSLMLGLSIKLQLYWCTFLLWIFNVYSVS